MIYSSDQFSELTFSNNPGVLMGKLPSDVFDSLKQDVATTLENKTSVAHNLVGMIEELYDLRLSKQVTDYIGLMLHNYRKKFRFRESATPRLVSCWVNMQKKHEYSPIHSHPRTLGWVIWVKIPYNFVDEINMANSVNSRVKKNSTFEFVYANLNGEIQTHTLNIDKTYEGAIMMFPNYLKHTVYPFYTSDDYRISVAGNIELVD